LSNLEDEIKSVDAFSMDLEKMNREKLKSVFPECFVEGKLDIDKLLSLCGEYIIEDFEKYKFEWKGKSECLQLAQKRSMCALRPCPDESVDFENTKNIYIEGDNLEVLKLLQIAYFNKVKMIYIDPPYNTGHDFVYEDDYTDPIERYRAVTSQATKSNPETMGRFHTKWLNMMYPRLRLAANLLKDDGVIFISIDDSELFNLKKICDEVFGEENFVGNIVVKSNPRGSQSDRELAEQHEYLLLYAKNIELANIIGHELSKEMVSEYKFEDEKGKYRLLGLRQRGGFWRRSERPNLFYSIFVNPKSGEVSLNKDSLFSFEVKPIQPTTGEDGSWRWSKEKFINNINNLIANKINRKGVEVWDIFQKDYIGTDTEVRRTKAKSLWDDKNVNYQNGTIEVKNLLASGIFDYSKPVYLIKQMMKMIGDLDNNIIFDFFSGSATTAHAVMQLNAEDGENRQFIMVQLPELCDENSEAYKAGYKNICEIGKERIRRAGKKIVEENSQLKIDERETPLDIGFKVFKLDTSNLNEWNSIPLNNDLRLFQERLDRMLNKIKPDRSYLDVVYEVILKMGFPLSIKVSEIDINGKRCFIVGEECLVLICLESGLTLEDIEKMAEFKPVNLIFSKQSFADSNVLINAHYRTKDTGIEIKLV